MQTPIQVNFRKIDRSEAMEDKIQSCLDQLEKLDPTIIGCKVTIDAGAHGTAPGKSYHVQVALTLPGHEIVVGRDQHSRTPFQDCARAVEDAFGKVRGQMLHHHRRAESGAKRDGHAKTDQRFDELEQPEADA
jgi:ribosome-associated translation inhibitor RaiA